MNHRSNQQKVERAMKAALRKDRAKVKVSRISRNGPLSLTRQRVRTSVQASVFRRCPTCTGTGWVMNPESHSIAVLRKVMDRAAKADSKSAKVEIEWEAGELLRTTKWSAVQELEKRYGIRIEVQQSRALLPGQVSFTLRRTQKQHLSSLSHLTLAQHLNSTSQKTSWMEMIGMFQTSEGRARSRA